MPSVQWLLIGGPSHGKTLWIKGGDSVNFQGEGLTSHTYTGTRYLYNWKCFQIGMHNASAEEIANIPKLIDSTKLLPYAWVTCESPCDTRANRTPMNANLRYF